MKFGMFEYLQVEPTDARIDLEKLKVREKIHFYADIVLFEDELGDNGHSGLSVKIVSIQHNINDIIPVLFVKTIFNPLFVIRSKEMGCMYHCNSIRTPEFFCFFFFISAYDEGGPFPLQYIVTCQRGGVSNKTLGQRQDTGARDPLLNQTTSMKTNLYAR